MPNYSAFNNPWNVNPYGPPYFNQNIATPYYNTSNYNLPTINGQAASIQQPQPQPQFSNVWFTGGENEARMFPVAPNNAVALWSETEPVIYVKKADMAGKPSFIIYDLIERGTAPSAEQNIAPASAPAPKYVTEDSFAVLMDAVKNLGATVGNLQSSFNQNFEKVNTEISAIKDDVYGIAGKKKSVSRKVETEEDG